MSVSAEAFHHIRSKWEQREQASKLAQVRAMVEDTAHGKQRRRIMDKKENHNLLMRTENTPPQQLVQQQKQQYGGLRRLSSLQAITNFTKDAFARRKASKVVEMTSGFLRTPSLKVRNEDECDYAATPSVRRRSENEQPPVTAFRRRPDVTSVAPITKQGLRISRSKTTSFLPVLAKSSLDATQKMGLLTSSGSELPLSTPSSSQTDLGNPLPTTKIYKASLEQDDHSAKQMAPVAPRSQYTVFSTRKDSFYLPKFPASSFAEELEQTTSVNQRLARSATQPNFATSKYRATGVVQSNQFKLKDASLVVRNMPLEYWAGRFTSLRDHLRSQELDGVLPTNAAMECAGDSPSQRMTKEERIVREALTKMYAACETQEAAVNLKVFQMIIAKDYHLPNLRYFRPPWKTSDVAQSSPIRGERSDQELTSKKSFMERLLSSRASKALDAQSAGDLSITRIPPKGKLWF